MASRKKSNRQPRELSGLTILEDRYRAALNLELQKFPDKNKQEKYRQMRLSEALSNGLEEQPAGEVEIFGLEDLEVSQIRALSAVQILLERTDYKGNEPGQEINSEVFKWTGHIPKLKVSYPEFLEAYGLQRTKSGRYSRAERDEALKALESLTQSFRIGYERKHYTGKGKKREQLSDIVITDRALIGLSRGYKNLTQEEAAKVKAGESISGKRAGHLIIEPGPMFLDQIESFYVLKPVMLYREIADLLAQKQQRARVSKIYISLIEWLLTKNTKIVRVSLEKLAERLGLYYLIESRQKKRLKTEILKAIDIALALGYLLEWQEGEWGGYVFTLNPDRAGRKLKEISSGEDEQPEGAN